MKKDPLSLYCTSTLNKGTLKGTAQLVHPASFSSYYQILCPQLSLIGIDNTKLSRKIEDAFVSPYSYRIDGIMGSILR